MGLQFDDRLRERLRQIRAAQLQDLQYWASVEDLLVAWEVVAVRDGFGGASFIGLDGRVIQWNSREPYPAEEYVLNGRKAGEKAGAVGESR